ncbi:hypothetical protein L596_020979 [Steinernema carpocapsae]|uniref:Uncharacterized protein n=1 Tax=Steinernema carpocapsae TaxID=34508 RepID=A0A4U5MVB6_STECR|nr:hypothetical protein L596_020979 [Steinernema carpocapsae]
MTYKQICLNANAVENPEWPLMLTRMYPENTNTIDSVLWTATLTAFWLAYVIYSTVFGGYGEILSLKRSWQGLTTLHRSKLQCINYFRATAILWVMVNHLGSEGRIDILGRLPSAKVFKVFLKRSWRPIATYF